MVVTFQSECEKKSLKKTRRILDSFANRIGQRSWQTVITMEGLNAVKKLLKKTSSKNTAVACHWIRGHSRAELLWIIGNRNKFDHKGFVPVNTTKKDLIHSNEENSWNYLPAIKALTALAGLFHDWGKASVLFQEKLKSNSSIGDPIRHEWISSLLFQALIIENGAQDDRSWLEALSERDINESKITSNVAKLRNNQMKKLPPVASLLNWLILSHHRLPSLEYNSAKNWRDEQAPDITEIFRIVDQTWGYENNFDTSEYQKRLKDCFIFTKGLLAQSSSWAKLIKKWSNRLIDCLPVIEQSMENGAYRLILQYTRLSLMLGDHYYSSLPKVAGSETDIQLYANTDRVTKTFKQTLDNHLIGVTKSALRIAHLLPKFESDLDYVQSTQALKKPSPAAFSWQDRAVNKIKAGISKDSINKQGFFVINMASTGCGKTFANAKIMRTLSSDGKSLRFILALGLRTLTLQTGGEYRIRMGLDDSELAVLIGSKAILELYKQNEQDDLLENEEFEGSESSKELLTNDIDYYCDIPEDTLSTVLTRQKDRQFLYAPVLTCTIDHIIAATETKRGGRYILPFLRLMSSDIVIDEVDDFSGSDLIAIGRLIHLAGMLGRKVMISSATIPPDLAEGYFNVYHAGWQIYSKIGNAENKVSCSWVDEFKTHISIISHYIQKDAVAVFKENHEKFITKRVEYLNKEKPRRKADIVICQKSQKINDEAEDETVETKYFDTICEAIISKHMKHHSLDKQSGTSVSFGVVRMANIAPCVSVSKYLMECNWPQDINVKVMAYHSQQVLLLRHEQEKHLDQVLNRSGSGGSQITAFENKIIRQHLDTSKAKHVIFIVVSTPIEEIGRDHDFDWAVIEPSSFRSIIQMAGRIRRHRTSEVKSSNISLMQYNLKALKDGDQPGKTYFKHPGYEEGKYVLPTHDLSKLVDVKLLSYNINAIPRIKKPSDQNSLTSLAHLEHAVTQKLLTNYEEIGPEELNGYVYHNWYLTGLPQVLHPFRKSEPSTNLFLMYDSDTNLCVFVEKDKQGHPVIREGILHIKKEGLLQNNSTWLNRNYEQLIEVYAEKLNLTKKAVSLRFGELNFVYREQYEYVYSDQFGLVNI
ncbi:MAG: type I-F CRISPR-associated helicase Cas3f [Candidatus Cloacimonetes bacterium]|nr:type I-F CRISPR-associated helicase Cas3f [Candidatus Cloacimonadota bacterium]